MLNFLPCFPICMLCVSFCAICVLISEPFPSFHPCLHVFMSVDPYLLFVFKYNIYFSTSASIHFFPLLYNLTYV